MANLRKYFRVSFSSNFAAINALHAAKKNFYTGLQSFAKDFDHVEGSTVFIVKTTDVVRDNQVFKFLLNQPGALPEGCHLN